MRMFFLALCCAASVAAAAQWQPSPAPAKQSTRQSVDNRKPFIPLGFSYNLTLPMGSFRQGMSVAHGFDVQGGISLPSTDNRLVAGAYLGWGVYATETYGIQYQQGANHIDTRIQYSSDLVQAGGQLQYLFSVRRRFQPYVLGRAGYAGLSSSFYIADPTDPLACRSLASETVLSDGSFVWSYGGGMRLSFTKNSRPNNFLDISFLHSRGGEVRYVNVGKLMPQTQPLEISEGAKPLPVEFINVSDGSVHRHNIAEVFRHPFNAVQIRVAYVWDILLRR